MRDEAANKREYPGRYAGICGTKNGRVPLIPGYSHIFPHNETWGIKKEKLKMQNSRTDGDTPGRRCFRTGNALHLARSVRFGTHKSAWDRLGPDKFFSPAFARRLPPSLASYGETSRRDKPHKNGGENRVEQPSRKGGKRMLTASRDAFERKCSSRGRNERRPRRACSPRRAMAGVSTQVVDISSRMARMRVAIRLISRHFPRFHLYFYFGWDAISREAPTSDFRGATQKRVARSTHISGLRQPARSGA
jgi:hypothetical protein